MPAGPIGSVWAAGSWSATAWEANTWANVAGGGSGTGQIPQATRYRMGYRVSHIVKALLAMMGW